MLSVLKAFLCPLQYKPLPQPDSQIRLLRIPARSSTPRFGSANYALFHAHLSSEIRYKALSYTWGKLNDTELILINGKLMRVTRSLFDALSALQQEDRELIIWIDAVCINQNDAVEKTTQVQLMRQIYKTAEEVIIWLGSSTPETVNTMNEIRKLGDQVLGLGAWNLTTRDIIQWSPDHNITESNPSHTKTAINELCKSHLQQCHEENYPFWWVMSDIGQRQWFTRVWCIQECANAQKATFTCGHQSVDFNTYWAAALYSQLFNNHVLLHPTGNNETDMKMIWLTGKLTSTFPTEFIGIRRRTLTSGGHGLMSLLYLANVLDSKSTRIEATLPEDRVFALLGLANDTTAQEITVDYTISCEIAYTRTARVLLKHGHDDVLSLCRKRELCENLPSWVPDWSAENRKPWSIWDQDQNQNRLFNASGANSIEILETDDSRHLTLRGFFVDTIKSAGSVWSLGIADKFDYSGALDFMDDIFSFLSASSRYTQQQKEEAKWRLPIGDTEVSDLTSQVIRATPNSHMQVGYAVLRQVAASEAEPERLAKKRRPFACYMAQMERMHDSRPFLTDNGYVGIAPMTTQPGHKIIILLGARVPYVVSTTPDDSYTLVGESHVCGIMDGELMQQAHEVGDIRLS